MVYSANTEIYNTAFISNYKKLLNFAKGNEDNVHESYLKTLNRITENGFTASTESILNEKIITYTKTVIYNKFKTNHKLKKNNIELNFEAETTLLNTEKQLNDEKLYYEELEYYTIKLFEYLKKYHKQEDNYVFRVYYLYDKNNKKITYKRLSQITGYSIFKVCGIIQKLKKDIKNNLINYIKNETV